MNIINEHNIDKWLFDYFEGNLSLHEKLEVEKFIQLNPSYSEDFEAWSKTSLTPNPMVYQGMDNLLKATPFFYKRSVLLLLLFLTLGLGLIGYKISSKPNKTIATNTITTSNKKTAKNVLFSSTPETISNASSNGGFTPNQKSEKYQNKASVIRENNPDKHSLYFGSTIVNNEAISLAKNANESSYADYPKEESKLTNKNALSIEDTRTDEPKTNTTKNIDTYFSKTMDEGYYSTKNTSKRSLVTKSSLYHSNKKYMKIKFGNKDVSKKYSLAKNITRLFNKDLALTVYNNRIQLANDVMTLHAFNGFVGNVHKTRIQSNYQQEFSGNKYYTTSISGDFKVKSFGFGALFQHKSDANNTVSLMEAISSYTFGNEYVSIIPSVNVKTGLYNGSYESLDGNFTNTQALGYSFTTGLLMEFPFAYAGIQANNLVGIDAKNYQSSLFGSKSYRIMAGTDYRKFISTDVVVSPQVYVDIASTTVTNFVLTSRYKSFISGGAYNTNHQAKGMVGLEKNNFRFTYTASTLVYPIDIKGVQHEIGMQVILSRSRKDNLVY